MKINFYATLRSIVGQKTIDVEAATGITAGELIQIIVRDYPKLRIELLDANNELHRHQKFFINGREVVYLEKKMDTPIHPDDKIDIFPPVGGG